MRRLLVLALLVLAAPPAEAEPPPAGEAAERVSMAVDRAIRDLGSGAERVRLDAVARLVAWLPEARPRVLEAVGHAAGDTLYHLVQVLVADASDPAARALVGIAGEVDDPLALKIQRLVVASPSASRAVLALEEKEPGAFEQGAKDARRRRQALGRLLRRGEVEAQFLSKKSPTGSTGAYSGQYDVLRPHRRVALNLCLDILKDSPAELPGVYPLGKFDFLRRPNMRWNIEEIQSMAAHCFGELATSEDSEHLQAALALLQALASEVRALEDDYTGGFRDLRYEIALDRYADLVVAYYRVGRKGIAERLLADLLRRLRRPPRISRQGFGMQMRRLAAVLLRVRRYEEAIRTYEMSMQGFSDDWPAMTHYNLACAYAQWGETFEGRARELRREKALDHLDDAILAQWSDTGWLDEDRDLDPIRKTRRFAALRARMVKANALPDEDRAPGSGAGSGR